MKDKHQGNGHKTETPDVSHIRNVEVTHETSDISVRGVMTFVIVLTLSGIAIHLGVAFLYNFLSAQEAKEPGPGPMALSEKERLPPEPRLQSAKGFGVELESGQRVGLELSQPQDEYRVLRKQWDENLKTGYSGIESVAKIEFIAHGNSVFANRWYRRLEPACVVDGSEPYLN